MSAKGNSVVLTSSVRDRIIARSSTACSNKRKITVTLKPYRYFHHLSRKATIPSFSQKIKGKIHHKKVTDQLSFPMWAPVRDQSN